MRAALYYPWLYLKGGAERMILELLRRSSVDWTLFTNHFEPHATFPEFADLPVATLSEVPVERTILQVMRAATTIRFERLDLEGFDAALIASEGLGNLKAGRLGVPTSCLCMTPLKVAYDPLTRDRFVDGRRYRYRAAFAAFRWVDRRTWRRYERVFCVSEEVRRRLLQERLVDETSVEVMHPGVDTSWFRPSDVHERYFLIPGRIMWQKNIELGLEAWRLFRSSGAAGGARLVVAGMVDRKSATYLARLRALADDGDDITFVANPSDDELLQLYRRCRAVVFTAHNEDFGLVPLEAMACGKPVIAPDRGGPRETVVDGVTGRLLPPTPEAFAEGLLGIATMRATSYAAMSRSARERAYEFGWDRFVSRIDAHIQDIAGRGARARSDGAADRPGRQR